MRVTSVIVMCETSVARHSEGAGELLAKLLVLLGQLAVALVGGFEPLQQGRVQGPLAGRDRLIGRPAPGDPHPVDLGP